MGANGIGKSTLLRTITGIQKPLTGTVLIDGNEVSTYTPLELAKKRSVVLTEPLPPSNLTVYELVALGRQPHTNWLGNLNADDHQKVVQALSLAQVEHLAQRKHFEISDGQLQKVLIARALAQDTPVVVLDEPTTHLDLVHKVTLFKLLKTLASTTNKCILLSTHDVDLAIQLSDEIMLMTPSALTHGTPSQLIANGDFDTLFDDPSIYFDRDRMKFVYINL